MAPASLFLYGHSAQSGPRLGQTWLCGVVGAEDVKLSHSVQSCPGVKCFGSWFLLHFKPYSDNEIELFSAAEFQLRD